MENQKIVYVSNIHPNTEESKLKDLLLIMGPIQNSKKIKIDSSSYSMIVQYENSESAKRSILLNKMDFYDRIIRVEFASSELLRTLDFKFSSDFKASNSNYVNSTALSIVESMLTSGYLLSKDAILEAKKLDNSTHDSKNKTVMSLIHDGLKAIDKKYDISTKLMNVSDGALTFVYHKLTPPLERLNILPSQHGLMDLIMSTITLSLEDSAENGDILKEASQNVSEKISNVKQMFTGNHHEQKSRRKKVS